jgi:ferredoxin
LGVSRVVVPIQNALRRPLARVDAWLNKLYGRRYNPVYQSGAIVVASFAVLVVTGLYLLLFYRIGTPYASVERLAGQAFAGSWIRSLHRYVSDLAIVAALVHAFRMFVQDRAWGPRALAWLSGVVLLLAFLVSGWTGYVMVWDTHGQWLAVEGARLFDVLPIFSEPISRAFSGERPVPNAFFFLNLFAHIAIPVGIVMALWVHVSRLARTNVMPPKPLFWGIVGVFVAVSVFWPAPLAPEADLLRRPATVPIDVFYSFWVPLSQKFSADASGAAAVVLVGVALLVPLVTRPRGARALPPSVVNPRHCTGCEQCYHDCPYEAISMVRRDDGREGYVGLVDPTKCVSCGICSGSCAPMGVGPEGRSGRDQLTQVRAFLEGLDFRPGDITLVGCAKSGAGWGHRTVHGASVLEVSCAGNLHTSVIEYLIRGGAGGVMVVTCPPRDCWNREGVMWLEERVHNRREAELQDRVDRRRLRIVHAAEAERTSLDAHLTRFRAQMSNLDRALGEKVASLDAELAARCEPPPVSVAEESTS